MIMYNGTFLVRLVLAFFIIISMISNASAITAEPADPSGLPSQLDEGAQISFTFKITDFDQRSTDNLKIETDLLKSGNSPIYDFGDLNEYIDSSRDRQDLYLNLSSIPPRKVITVTVLGKSPSGTIEKKIEDGIVVTKFRDGNLKYYEVSNGDKSCGIETFKLNIEKKKQFEDTMQQINLDEFSLMKQEVRKLYDFGFVTEAQSMASEMSKIKLHDNLSLFGVLDIKTNSSLNVVTVGFLFLGLITGFVLRMKLEAKDEE